MKEHWIRQEYVLEYCQQYFNDLLLKVYSLRKEDKRTPRWFLFILILPENSYD